MGVIVKPIEHYPESRAQGKDAAFTGSHFQPFLLAPGGTVDGILSGWTARTIYVDNFTSQYVYLPDAGVYVAPFSLRVAVPLQGVGSAHAWYQAPPGVSQPASNNASAYVIFAERVFEAVAGEMQSSGLVGSDGKPLTFNSTTDTIPVWLRDQNGNSIPNPNAVDNIPSQRGLFTVDVPYWYNGVTFDRQRGATVFKDIPAVAVVAGSPIGIWLPAAGKRFRLQGWAVSLSVAGSVIFSDNATEIIRTPLMPAGTSHTTQEMDNGILSSAANNPLAINVTASGSVSGYVFGNEE